MNTRKQALVTLRIGNFPMARITHPLFQKYCARHNLGFIVINRKKILYQPRLWPDQQSSSYEKFQIFELLATFERLLYLDGDILLHADCPNLFDLVPPDQLGCVYEDVGADAYKRFDEMDKAQRLWGKLPDYRGGYFNAGMMVVSRAHRELFSFGPDKKFGGRWPDQTTLNYYCEKLGYVKKNLGPSYNLLPVYKNLWANDFERQRAFIVHYAGKESKGLFKKDHAAVLKSCEKDLDAGNMAVDA